MNSIEELIADIAQGRMVVVLDDEERENEGDLIMAASLVRPEDINFMAHYARGLICLALTRERCSQLRLPLMVQHNQARFTTAFTVSIEAASGVTTGISAYDRAHTVRTAVQPDARPEDLTQPGHVFPLMAQPGGVLTRAGHTEAGCDLAQLAGLEPAAVLVEVLKEDGSMARRPELEAFAERHGVKIGTVADLIRYRLSTEKTVSRVAERDVDTEHGPFRLIAYRDIVEKRLHLALVRGDIAADEPTLVRVHVQNMLSDVLAMRRQDFGLPLRVAMQEIARAGRGVVVILGEGEADGDDVVQRLLEQPRATKSLPESSRTAELRTYGVGAQILADVGVRKMRVLSAPKRFHGLAGFGLEVVEYVEPGGQAAASPPSQAAR